MRNHELENANYQELCQSLRLKEFNNGELIYRFDDLAKEFYIIIRGKVKMKTVNMPGYFDFKNKDLMER